MNAHKVIDELKERLGILNGIMEMNTSPLLPPPPSAKASITHIGSGIAFVNFLIENITKAIKFEFNNVPFKFKMVNRKDRLTGIEKEQVMTFMPKLEENESSWFSRGLIPLGAPVVWYEYKQPSNEGSKDISTVCLLIIETKPCNWDTYQFSIHEGRMTIGNLFHSWDFEGNELKQRYKTVEVPNDFPITNYNTPNWYENGGNTSLTKEEYCDAVASRSALFTYLTLMINSRSTVVEQIKEPSKLNKKRLRNDKTPIDEYKRVILISKKVISVTGEGGTVMKLHYCRSHIRHYENKTPNSTWVPDMTYNEITGWWIVIIPGHFKGVADHGTITHDYTVY